MFDHMLIRFLNCLFNLTEGLFKIAKDVLDNWAEIMRIIVLLLLKGSINVF